MTFWLFRTNSPLCGFIQQIYCWTSQQFATSSMTSTAVLIRREAYSLVQLSSFKFYFISFKTLQLRLFYLVIILRSITEISTYISLPPSNSMLPTYEAFLAPISLVQIQGLFGSFAFFLRSFFLCFFQYMSAWW